MRDMASERRRIFVRDVPQVTPRGQRLINLPGPIHRTAGDSGLASIDRESRRLLVLDDELEPTRELRLPGLPQPGAQLERLLILKDLTVILLCLDHVVCVDPSGSQRWRLSHPSWPSGMVDGDAVVIEDRLVIAVPGSPVLAGYGVNPVELAIVDIADGSESRERLIDEIGDPAGFHAITRPDGRGGALDAGYGQDGSQIWRITPSAGRPEVTPLGTFDRILADLSPKGDEILTAPHVSGGLIVYRWDDLSEAARLERAEVFEEEDELTADRFDFYAYFLSSVRLLALTQQGRLLLIDRVSMTVESQVVPDGLDIIGFDERGRPVDHPEQAVGFAGDIIGVTVIDENRILVHGRDGRSDLCEL